MMALKISLCSIGVPIEWELFNHRGTVGELELLGPWIGRNLLGVLSSTDWVESQSLLGMGSSGKIVHYLGILLLVIIRIPQAN